MSKSLTNYEPESTALLAQDGIETLRKAWLESLDLRVRTGEITQATLNTYQAGFDRFLAWHKDTGQESFKKETIREWIAYSLASLTPDGNPIKPNSVNVWLSGVRSFFSWAVDEKGLEVDPTAGVKGAKRKGTSRRHLRDTLTDQQVRRVLNQPDDSPGGIRDKAILALMAYTGARTIEIHRANIDDLKSEAGRLVLMVQGKGHESADDLIVLAHPAVVDAIYDWLAVRGDKPGALFTSLANRSRGKRLTLSGIRHMVKTYYKATGIHERTKTTHSLRHTAISNAIRNGAPPQKAQSMARHESLDTTMIYYHEIDRLENPAEGFIDYGEPA